MKTAFYIARRYFFSKKSQNVINIISGISVFGIAISTAALVIVLSAFNGIEGLVMSLFSEFDADITITVKEGKTFDNRIFEEEQIAGVEGVTSISPVIEEIVVLKNDEKWVNAKLLGVTDQFLKRVNIQDHMKDGKATIEDSFGPLMLCGSGVMYKLSAYVSRLDGTSSEIVIYAPKRNVTYSPTNVEQPFNQRRARISGVFSYNKEVDLNYCVMPIKEVSDILQYQNDISRLEVEVEDENQIETIQSEIQKIIPSDFEVRTRLQKNDLIYKTSKTEKWITVFILAFIFLLASFNMIASLTMLMLEKRKDIFVLLALGARKKQIRNIFFLEGLMINFIGGGLGLLLGYAICWSQINFGFVTMEGGIVDVYPIVFKISDFIVIISLIMVVGTLSSYFPVRFMRVKSVRL